MKLLINATILSNKNTGLGMYTYNVLESIVPLLKSKPSIKFNILCSSIDYLPENAKEYGIAVNCSNPFKRLKSIKKCCKNYDCLWSTTQHGIRKPNIKQIITIHDITPILYPKGRIKQTVYYKLFLPRIIRKTDYIVTVSYNTKKDILSYYNFDDQKIKVFYPALPKKIEMKDLIPFDKISTNYLIQKSNYFVITGIHYPYKNLQLVVEGFKKSDLLKKYKVLIVGNDSNKYGKYLKKLIKKYNLENNFVFTGFISDNEKNTLLVNSLGAIYPSKYEGFGLPILEAMASKTPLYTSKISSIPEIAKDYAFYFNPNSIEDFVNCLEKNILNKNDIDEKIKMSDTYLNDYSWDVLAKNIFEMIESIE